MSSMVDLIDDAGGMFDSVEREAADWFVRIDRGLTRTEKKTFARWLAADNRHAEIFGEIAGTWSKLGQVSTSSPSVTKPAKGMRLGWFPIALGAAAAITAACLLWRGATSRGQNFTETLATDVGTLREVNLPDNSVVQLSADSLIDVQFTSRDRQISLRRGEASFKVAKNSKRPFIVHAGAVDVVAVGTAFDVRLRPTAVDLLVTEGKVGVHSSIDGNSLIALSVGGNPLLMAGQCMHIPISETSISSPTTAVALSKQEIEEILAWHGRRLIFHDDRLADIVAEFNRFNRHKLVMGSSELAIRRFGGTFPANGYGAFVKSLEEHYGVTAEERPNETVLTLAATGSRPLNQPALSAEPESILAPRAGRLVFRSEPLVDIVAQFNRYNRHKLVIADPALGAMRFGGTYPAGDTDFFVRVLEENFHVVAEVRENETLLRIKP